MEQFARPPPELSSKGPMDANWRTWKQQFLIFLKASGVVHRPEDYKANLLMNLMGQVGQEIFQNFTFDEPSDSDNMHIILEKFDNHFDPKKSEAHERYVFFTSKKKNGQSLEQYISEMKIKAKTCNFGDMADSLIRDKIILDVKDKGLRDHLLSEPDLSLSQTIILWQTHERTTEKLMQLHDVKNSLDKDVKAKVSFSGDTNVKVKNYPSSSKTDNRVKKDKPFTHSCWRCGIRHDVKKCPAWGKKCEKCGTLNHFTQYCGNAPPPKNNVRDKMNTQMKNISPGPFNQIPAKVMNKDAVFKNNK